MLLLCMSLIGFIEFGGIWLFKRAADKTAITEEA